MAGSKQYKPLSIMTPRLQEKSYREKAEHCRRMADDSSTYLEQQAWLGRDWLALADEVKQLRENGFAAGVVVAQTV